jgi:hypothetical protein
MKALRQLGVVILLLMSYLTPAMACMMSDVQMNAQEQACCRTMKSQCEQVGMPASHGCCQKASHSVNDSALDTKAITYDPIAVLVIWLTSDWFDPTQMTAGLIEQSGYSPPQAPPSSIFVLKI